MLWASEFVEAARDTYRANFPSVHIDERDIRQVTAESVLEQTGLKAGELDVMEGSPPCASFSIAGKRDRDWGEIKSYSDTAQRTDDLFFEYARLVRGIQPRVWSGGARVTNEGHGWFQGGGISPEGPAPTVVASSEGGAYYKHRHCVRSRRSSSTARITRIRKSSE